MEPGYQLLAAKYVRRQAKQLADQLDGVRAAEDVEYIHRARVATRRLQTALWMFKKCFGRKKLRGWRKAVCELTAKLGDARDRDVQIGWLCGVLTELNVKEHFPGVSRVLVELERERERLQREVIKAVERFKKVGALWQMRRFATRCQQKTPGGIESWQTPEIHDRIVRHLLRQRDQLLQHQDCLSDPHDHRQHHAMRIAVKRFRYTLEIARIAYPGQFDGAIDVVKKLQAFLGDMHDCDVWQEHLDRFTILERRRMKSCYGHARLFSRLQPGVEYLRRNRLMRRQEAFEQLVAFWKELDRQRFWECLDCCENLS